MTEAGIRIRAMTAEDLDQVIAIEQEVFSFPWSRQAFADDLQRRGLAFYLVAESQAGIIAYAAFWLIVDEAHVITMSVHPQQRRKRVAERLLLRLFREAERQGACWLTLEVRQSNQAARCLYRKFGFQEIALRRGYYADNNEDAVVMWSGLISDDGFKCALDGIAADNHEPGGHVEDV